MRWLFHLLRTPTEILKDISTHRSLNKKLYCSVHNLAIELLCQHRNDVTTW